MDAFLIGCISLGSKLDSVLPLWIEEGAGGGGATSLMRGQIHEASSLFFLSEKNDGLKSWTYN